MKFFARLMASFIFIWVAVRPSGAAAGTIGASQLDCAIAGHAAPARKTRVIANRKCIVPPAPSIALRAFAHRALTGKLVAYRCALSVTITLIGAWKKYWSLLVAGFVSKATPLPSSVISVVARLLVRLSALMPIS